MNIKDILSDVVKSADLSDENRKTLNDWLEQFENVPKEQQLLNTIEQLTTQRDNAEKSLNELIYKNNVASLAEKYSFSDKGYLEYLCKLNNIDFADDAVSKNFMQKLQSDAPKFFKPVLQAGSGVDSPVDPRRISKDYQHDDILSLLNNAPEFRG